MGNGMRLGTLYLGNYHLLKQLLGTTDSCCNLEQTGGSSTISQGISCWLRPQSSRFYCIKQPCSTYLAPWARGVVRSVHEVRVWIPSGIPDLVEDQPRMLDPTIAQLHAMANPMHQIWPQPCHLALRAPHVSGNSEVEEWFPEPWQLMLPLFSCHQTSRPIGNPVGWLSRVHWPYPANRLQVEHSQNRNGRMKKFSPNFVCLKLVNLIHAVTTIFQRCWACVASIKILGDYRH